MERSTAFTAVAALGLTVIAGVSAVALTFDQGPTAAPASPAAAVTQYVDQYGNPVDPPGTAAATAAPTVTETASPAPRSSAPTVRVASSQDDDEHEYEED